MGITITKKGDRVVAGIPEQLGLNNRLQLKQMVAEEVERGERKFLLDFSQTGYIDSSGLGVLVSLSKQIRERGGELVITGLNEDLRTLFALTKFDALLHIGEKGDGLAGQPARLNPKPPGPLEDAAAEQRPDIPPLN